jgi:hypothetical protein
VQPLGGRYARVNDQPITSGAGELAALSKAEKAQFLILFSEAHARQRLAARGSNPPRRAEIEPVGIDDDRGGPRSRIGAAVARVNPLVRPPGGAGSGRGIR